MAILINVAVVIVIVLTIIFSTRVQNAVFQTLQIAGVLAQGAYNRVTPIVGAILQAAWTTARYAAIGLLIMWALNLIIFWGVGIAIGAPWCGFALGVLLPLTSILYILRSVPYIKRAVRIPLRVACVIIILALPYFIVGSWSPEVLSGIDYWSADKKETLANSFYKDSFKSEAKVGVITKLTEETVGYDNKGQAVWRMPKGSRIMVISLKGYPKSERIEGMALVMLENKYGDFVNGNIVFVPRNKVQM